MKVPAGCTVILGVLLGCSPGDASEDQGGRPEMDDRAATSVASVDPGVPTVADWEALVRSLEFRVDSAEQVLVRIPNLTSRERSRLRADANARQTARATALGIPRGGAVEPLEERGRLRRLPESTRLWEIRDLDYSVPYVTPDAESMLVEIGERWMAALDSLGLPPFRMEITSVLRTPADQARLRRSNANAARGASSHEFGTTLDIAYRRYAAPRFGGTDLENVHPSLRSRLETTHDSLFVELASRRGTELEAVLGRVIEEMRSEGKLLVMMERQQTVYHITVARRLPAREMSEVE
jgi:hypothetical protein